VKVIVKNEFINIMLKEDRFLGTCVEKTIQMFGHVVRGAFLCGDEEGFNTLSKALAICAQSEIKRIKANRPEREQDAEDYGPETAGDK